MKIRYSLVSNSSSSSFICNMPILEASLEMYKIIAGYSQYTKLQQKKMKANIKKLCKQVNVQTGAAGICLPSCNYDSYLLVHNGQCIIDTCNNYSFYEIDGFIGRDEEENFEIQKDKFFYYTFRKNLLLSRDTRCLPHDSNIDLICPTCARKWGAQNPDMAKKNNEFYIDLLGNRYCVIHWTKLKEIKRITEIKTP